jgi:phosphate starvation-inducible PhoH-like protein
MHSSFIILDEAQNTTIEQMKMSDAHRFGSGRSSPATSPRQTCPAGRQSGLSHVVELLRNVEGVAFTFFDAHDVRHPLVQRIVQAYERGGGS